jgi:hypothetical protein
MTRKHADRTKMLKPSVQRDSSRFLCWVVREVLVRSGAKLITSEGIVCSVRVRLKNAWQEEA